jgi:hypothetical protein
MSIFFLTPFVGNALSLLPTKAVAGLANPDLIKGMTSFEKIGGQGGWFQSISPFSTEQKPEYFYLIKKIPAKADPMSDVWLMRIEHTRDLLSKLVESGRVIIIGQIPSPQVTAAAIGVEYQLAADAIALNGDAHHAGAMLLQLTADKYTLAHENQHLTDYEDSTFDQRLKDDLKDFVNAKSLSDADQAWLHRIVLEIRGHSMQEIQGKSDAANGLPVLDFSGKVHTMPEELKSNYGVQMSFAVSNFMNSYPSILWPIASHVKAQGAITYKKFVEALSKYDFSTNPNASLSFKKLIGGTIK